MLGRDIWSTHPKRFRGSAALRLVQSMDMADKHPGKKGRTGASSSASESRSGAAAVHSGCQTPFLRSWADTNLEHRKLRNRLSQKAFRARQSLYIKELEKRLEWSKKSGVEPNAELEEANRELRARLLDCYKKLESMQVTLKTLSDSVAIALGIEVRIQCLVWRGGQTSQGLADRACWLRSGQQRVSAQSHPR